MSEEKKDLNLESILLHSGHVPDTDTGSRAVPIYQTTSYVFINILPNILLCPVN